MSTKRFTKGPKILVDFGNRILDEVDGITVKPTPQMPQSKTKHGIILMPNNSEPPAIIRPFFTTDQSAGGPNGLISITAGSVTDLTNSGTVWTGTTGLNLIYLSDYLLGNIPFALPITGPPVRQPALQLNPAATCAYLEGAVDATTGFITAMNIFSDTGSGMPVSNSTHWRQLLTTLSVSIVVGVASVTFPKPQDGAQSSLFFATCGIPPITDGTQYRVCT